MTTVTSKPVEGILLDADTLLYRVGYSNPATADIAIHRLDATINEIYYKIKDTFGLGPEPLPMYVYITTPDGKGRYRDRFNNKSVYKEHRGKVPPPVFMDEMRDFIKRRYICVECPSSMYEADDAISWKGWYEYEHENNYVIAGVDKDLNQIPGWHFDYGTNRSYHVTAGDANRFFFKQLLMGDVADNIKGIKGIGPKRADTILSRGSNSEDWWDLVLETYTKHYPEKPADEVADLLYERGNKLWIQRYEGQTWYPPVPENSPF